MPRFPSVFFVPTATRYLLAFSIALFTLLTSCDLDEEPVLCSPSPPPTLTAIIPDSAFAGDTITITGSGFRPEFIENIIRFNDSVPEYDVEAYGIVSASPTELRVIVPDSAISGPVTVAVGGLCSSPSNAIDFKVLFIPPAPIAITGITPDTAYYGDNVTITGRGFTERNLESVYFGQQQFDEVTSIDTRTLTNTSVRVRVLDGAQSGEVFMRFEGGPTIKGPILTIAPPAPVITSFTPDSGSAGTTVTMTGNGFYEGTTTVTLNGASLKTDVVSKTKLEVVIREDPAIQPGNAFPFVVSNQEGTGITSANSFTITAVAAGTRYVYYSQGYSRDGAVYRAGIVEQNGKITATAAALFTAVGIYTLDPQDIILDAANNQIYWTDQGGSSSVYVGKTDGSTSDAESVFSGEVRTPTGLALAGDQLYWSERGSISRIRKGNADGTGDVTNLYGGNFEDPLQVQAQDVVVVGEFIYWTEPNTFDNTPLIKRGSINGDGEPEILFDKDDYLSAPQGLQIDAATNTIYVADGNRILVGNLNNRDGDKKLSRLFGSDDNKPIGLFLDAENKQLYWVDAKLGQILRVNLNPDDPLVTDGADPDVIIKDLKDPGFGIAVGDK